MTSARITVLAALLLSSAAFAAGTKAKAPAKDKAAAGADAKAIAHAKELVKGCTQGPLTDGVLFQCTQPIQIVVMVNEKAASSAELIDGGLGMIRSLGGDLAIHDTKIAVGEKQLPGQSFELTSQAAGREHIVGAVLALDVKPGTARSVLCFSTKPTETASYTCNKLFDALAVVGPAPFIATRPALVEPAFLGRKIGVPDGCRTVNSDELSFRVECPDGAAIFYSKTRSIRSAEIMANEFYSTFLKSGTAAPERPCVLGGVPISCRVVDSQGTTFYLGIATVGADPVIAICYQEPSMIVTHPVCRDVFSF